MMNIEEVWSGSVIFSEVLQFILWIDPYLLFPFSSHQIRRCCRDILFCFTLKTKYCLYLLDLSRLGGSNKYPQHKILCWNVENNPYPIVDGWTFPPIYIGRVHLLLKGY